MDGFSRLKMLEDWQVANESLRMSEKARLMAHDEEIEIGQDMPEWLKGRKE
ncbi:TPA: hypothetical protein TZC42_002430 [Streptococcus suis]|nr:hypothetical protein [Streptococcus suis]